MKIFVVNLPAMNAAGVKASLAALAEIAGRLEEHTREMEQEGPPP